MNNFEELATNLEKKIQKSYEEGITMEEAEKLAGEMLHAQMQLSSLLRSADLDSRMKKNGVKAAKAAAYLGSIPADGKKPTEAQLEHLVNTDKAVNVEQKHFDEAEVGRDNLDRYYNIFRDAHIHFRSIAKGKFD